MTGMNAMNALCHVCGAGGVRLLHAFDAYPRNSLYLQRPDVDRQFLSDFQLQQCERCFHLQGVSDMPLDDLYDDSYHSTTGNAGVQNRVEFMVEQVLQRCKGLRFNRVIDVGCNDLTLLSILKARGIAADHFIGIDPVSIDKTPGSEDILFINGYLQDVQIPFADAALPDLIVSDQVFEHIPRINEVLASFRDKIPTGSVFMVCVPSLELMIENHSFHNIIHEHINYFSENALARLFEGCGFALEKTESVNRPSIGLLLQTFTLPAGVKRAASRPPRDHLPAFKHHFDHFRRSLAITRESLERVSAHPLYGFGASDITANLAYFLQSDLAALSGIIDDTPYKQHRYMPLITPKIITLAEATDLAAATVLITAPQANRPIIARLLSLNPRKILNPLNVL